MIELRSFDKRFWFEFNYSEKTGVLPGFIWAASYAFADYAFVCGRCLDVRACYDDDFG